MPVVLLAPLPLATGEVKWRAETRGSTVVLLIDPRAKIETRAALGIIFTHELLHLWVPNSLLLEGDYDWFFEGFTLYIALITALDLKFINFDEYLATLARVYDSYLSHDDELSLIDASERRWTGGKSAVYDKGMLVAFLYDLHIAKQSGGGNRLNDRYRELFREHASKPADANEAIIQLLSSTVPTAALTKKYVEGSGRLELETALSSFGLRLDPSGRNTTLRIVKEVRGDQKQLLRSLGYR
jgi:predicted metalloprotease with PDZ domain